MAYTREVTNIDPYFDDFTAYRNFLRILYRPGRAVQARELTQMQTAAQWQLEQMASHIFADGSSIIGAKVKLAKNAPYIEILATDIVQTDDGITQIADPQILVGQHIQYYESSAASPSGTLAKIIAVDNNSGTLRIQLDYRGGEFSIGDKFVTVNYEDNDATNYPTKYRTEASGAGDTISAVGEGMRATVEEGVVYVNGFFAYVLPQEIFVTKSGVAGEFVVGYDYEEYTLEPEDTTALDPITGASLGDDIRDPAGQSAVGPPGADRYMVTVKLAAYEVGVDTIPPTFHQIIKTTDGIVEEKIEKTEYADILDMLAGRTYDESGNYTIEPYSLRAVNFDADNFNYIVGPGKSYAFGFERENITDVKVSAKKTRDTRGYGSGDLAAEARAAQYGTYVVAREGLGTLAFNGLDVSSANDTIDFPGHNFKTGDRVLYDVSTSTENLGLTDGTDYYVIIVDKDTIKLATSPANANAGTAVNLTTGLDENHLLISGIAQQGDGDIDPTLYEEVHLMSGYSGTGKSFGTAKVFFANEIGGDVRLYLGDNPSIAADLATCNSLCTVGTGTPTPGTDKYINIKPFNPINNIVGSNQAIIQLNPYVQSVSGVNYTTMIKITKTVSGPTSSYTLTTGVGTDTFLTGDPYNSIVMVIASDGTWIDPNAGDKVLGSNPTGEGTDTITVTPNHSLAAGTYDFYMMIDRVSATARSKTLTEATFDVIIGTNPLSSLKLDGTSTGLDAGSDPRPSIWDLAAVESIIEDPNGTNVNVTSSFSSNDGQKDLYYDYCTLLGTFKANTTYRVTLHYWAWGATGDFFAANSYARGTDDYFDDKGSYLSNIPLFTNEAKNANYNLRDCLDFRRNISELTTTAREIAAPGSTLFLTYNHYLPRWDRVWIDRSGKLGVTQGVPEETPALPPEVSGTMTLFNVFLAPYMYDPPGSEVAYDSDQVSISMIDQKNYTMLDIQRLDKRLTNLEQYSSEMQLELGAYADTVVDVDGFSRSKNGFFVDKFEDHRKGSVWEPTYRCSMDSEQGALRTPFEMNHIRFEYDNNTAAEDVQENTSESINPWKNTITLGLSSVQSWIRQPQASEYMNINPFSVTVWSGEIILNPASDTWIETRYAPTEQILDPDESARIRALYDRSDETGIPDWGAWTSRVIGVSRTTRTWRGRAVRWTRTGRTWPAWLSQETIQTTTQSTRTGTELIESGSKTVTQDMGERLVSSASIPWMRTIDIEFEAFGLRPNTTMTPYFAGEDISANVTWDASTPGGITKHNGYVKGVFTVPAKKFKTGKNIFTLKDTVDKPNSIASTEFRAEGTLNTRAKQILSVEVPTYSTRTITESEKTVDVETGEINRVRWIDPIAQTFLVEDEGGVFLESIDVFFATKDRYLPVSLYIVETIAGVPGQKRIPFSLVTMDADDVVATKYNDTSDVIEYSGKHYNNDGTTLVHDDGDPVEAGDTFPVNISSTPLDFVPTKFKFSDPVYLKEGVEYAFVLVSNSNNYNAYISRMGQFQLIKDLGEFNGAGITKQPHLGSLLKSQNTSTWTPDQYADIKFEIHRCDFDTSQSALYMRVKGDWDYWKNQVYGVGDQIIYDHSVDGLSVYQCVTATAATNEDPESTPAKWTRVQDGFLNATLYNISTDELVVPGTEILRKYQTMPETSWNSYTNKEDIVLSEQKRIELYTDDPANSTAPNGLNLELQLLSNSSWLTPVINKNRSFAVLVNNLIRDTDADAPASHTLKFDAGEYISETTQLKQPASSLKLLIDVAKPDADAIIVPKYRTVEEPIRYLDRDGDLTIGENELADQIDMQDRFAYVYHFNLTNADWALASITASSWEEKGTVVIDGLDATNSRLYLSSISNPENFGDKATVVGGTNPWILVTTEPDITEAEITIWDGTQVVAGDYAFNPTDKNLYRAEIDTVAPPTDGGLDWTLIGSVLVDGDIQLDNDVEWRPMQLVSSVKEGIDTTNFVEYEYEPLITPSEGFDNFAIKIEMYCGDAVNVPICKRLRVIAVD